MRTFFISLVAIFALDQISKFWVLEVLDLNMRGGVDVVPPYLNLRMAWNTGVNFGLFGDADMRWALIALALLICVWVCVTIWRHRPGLWGMVSAGALIGGALGNVVDRVRFGAVADFLNMSCCGINNPFAFNIADVGIALGVLGLVLTGVGEERKAS